MDDQTEVIRFLSDGASHGLPGARVERIDTHISSVFMVGDRACKLKRAVRFPYLDYSTLDARERFCRAELALNRRTAAAIYRDVRAVVRRGNGTLAFDGPGEILDWVVEMRRFEQDALLDRRLAAGQLTPAIVRELAWTIAAFHASEPARPEFGGADAMAQTIDTVEASLERASFDPGQVTELCSGLRAALARSAGLIDARRLGGKVRHCHGDLHLGNICMFEGHPVPFDCIEFDEELACIDVLYDLAFPIADLCRHGRADLACVLLNRYLDLDDEVDGLATMPLFTALRASIRAHVTAARGTTQGRAEAAAQFAAAMHLLHVGTPALVAIGGMSGSGKSVVADALAPDFLPAPGARVIRSDSIRKRMHGAGQHARLPDAAYATGTGEAVYRSMLLQAGATLRSGCVAILDATFLDAAQRSRAASLAAGASVPFAGLWLEAPLDVLLARVDARRDDVSDAGIDVVRRQNGRDATPGDWSRVDTDVDRDRMIAAARASVAAQLAQSRP